MNNAFGTAWRQLSHQKIKLLAACAGVVVAVMLMLVQLGIRAGAMESSIAFARKITADLVVVSPRTDTIFRSAQFPRRLLYRLSSDPQVTDVEEIYMGLGNWRNPWDHLVTPVAIYGIRPDTTMVDLPGYADHSRQLRLPDHFAIDSLSRTIYGPVVETIDSEGSVSVEVSGRRIHIESHFPVGVSISTDGSLYSDIPNFLRLNPERLPGSVDVGLIRLSSGADPTETVSRLSRLLGNEAVVMTREELIDSEIRFVRETAPIDFIFGMGAAVGFFIGFVVVYQILYTEVTNHLPQLATMKAMGFDNRYLLRLVTCQACLLAAFGYVPGFFMALGLYELAEHEIQMQFRMTAGRAFGVLAATMLMCTVSAVIAVRKAWSADPAEVF